MVTKDPTAFSVDKRIPKKPKNDSESTIGVPRLTDYIKKIDSPKAKVSELNTGQMPKRLGGKDSSKKPGLKDPPTYPKQRSLKTQR